MDKKVKIVDRDAPVLREMAKEVTREEIGSPELERIITDMKAALHAEDDGVAIAAPQINVSKRIFVVNGHTLAVLAREFESGDKNEEEIIAFPDEVYINPVIKKISKKRSNLEEGCLSVRWLYGRVLRSDKVTITALDENGKKITRGASGLLAQIFQHEIDHLNGILFIDTATDLEDHPPEHAHE